jgi:Hypothetical glycosyl hydrolase 6/Beta-galactosidase trimerisation domain
VTSVSREAGSSADLWWRRPFRMFQTNLREIDAGLDVEAVLAYLEDFGANAWLLSVGGIISGYPTDLGFQNRNPALAQRASGDLVGDAIAAAHARGIKVLARMDFSKVDRRVAEEHPDWCFVDPTGLQQVYNGLVSVCPSGPYYQDKVFEILTEVLDRYDVDGFFFNWLTYGERDYEKRYRGVCHCASCTEAFAQFVPGEILPDGPESPAYPQWKRFTTTMLDDWTARAREFIADRRPEAPLIMGDTSDITFHEANNAVNRPLWHHRCGEQVSVAKTYRPGTPVLVNAAAFVDMPYRLAGEEPHAYQQYLVQAIARGANPSIYIMGAPDVVRYRCLEAGREIIRFHRDHQASYANYRPAARTVLVRPYEHKATVAAEHSRTEFEGLWAGLLERHVPFDVVAEERIAELGEDRLSRYRLVVLPDLGPLASTAATALDEFVSHGGRVLATGSSGLDGGSPQLESFGVIRRSAVKDTRELTWSVHLVPDPEPDGTPGYPVPLLGAYHLLVPASGAETGMTMLSRAPYGPPEKCYGHYRLDQPGWISHRFGAGACTVMPWTVGRGYRSIGLSAYRDLFIEQALRLLDKDLDVETDLPEQVEVIVGQTEAGYLVHLRNVSGAGVQKFGPPLPIEPARLTVRAPGQRPARARALVAGQDLPVEHTSERQVSVQLPSIGLFEAVVFA